MRAVAKQNSNREILFSTHIDLNRHPGVDANADEFTQFTLGDLHGNALKLLAFLVRYKILELSVEDYEKLANLYAYLSYPHSYSSRHRENTKKVIDEFREILGRAKINKDTASPKALRLIGDVVADRGANDYLTLFILQKLKSHNIPFEILLSNHDMAFLSHYVKDFPSYNSRVGWVADENGQVSSYKNLYSLLSLEIIMKTELNDLVESCYLPYLKLVSYANSKVDENNKKARFYHHAYTGYGMIKQLKKTYLSTEEMREKGNSILDIIDAFNDKFSAKIMDKSTRGSLINEIMAGIKKERGVYYDLTWSRPENFQPNRQKAERFGEINWEFSYAYGHVGPSEGRYLDGINLDDSYLGRPGDDTGRLIVEANNWRCRMQLVQLSKTVALRAPEPRYAGLVNASLPESQLPETVELSMPELQFAQRVELIKAESVELSKPELQLTETIELTQPASQLAETVELSVPGPQFAQSVGLFKSVSVELNQPELQRIETVELTTPAPQLPETVELIMPGPQLNQSEKSTLFEPQSINAQFLALSQETAAAQVTLVPYEPESPVASPESVPGNSSAVFGTREALRFPADFNDLFQEYKKLLLAPLVMAFARNPETKNLELTVEDFYQNIIRMQEADFIKLKNFSGEIAELFSKIKALHMLEKNILAVEKAENKVQAFNKIAHEKSEEKKILCGKFTPKPSVAVALIAAGIIASGIIPGLLVLALYFAFADKNPSRSFYKSRDQLFVERWEASARMAALRTEEASWLPQQRV